MDSIEGRLSEAAGRARAFTSDSRGCGPGDLFVALPGANRDGHEFVPAVLAAGAVVVVAEGTVARLGLEAPAREGRVVEVPDSHSAHRVLAGRFRERFRGPVVAVGGSAGKTTAKEFLRALLATRFRVAATERSQNGEQGIPRTLEKLREGIDVAVVEVGIDAPGEMARHAALVAPDLAVLTSIGAEHLSRLMDVETVYREETVLFDVTLGRGGEVFVPEDDPYLVRQLGRPGVTGVPSDPLAIDPRFDAPFRHRLARRNAALAVAVASRLGVDAAGIVEGLRTLALPEGRGGERRLPGGAILVLDHYNANPDSMRSGLAHAKELADREGLPLRLVLGDMLDLGAATAESHRGLVGAIREARAEMLWLVGTEWSRLAGDLEGAAGEILTFDDSGSAARAGADALVRTPAVVLFKGSRGMALERVVEAACSR
jgi:UDP-N-acetylmuramoyl-tripeptide--D-alanyl-D-alanine ligase